MASQKDEIATVLSRLDSRPDLSITKLSEPILAQGNAQQQQQAVNGADQRSSDVSSTAGGCASANPTSASLEADLTHYKELFTKLRFSYVEQVTKEKFLRAVVGDPPLYVSAAENAALEAQLATVKASLNTQKAEVADMVTELERLGRSLSAKYAQIELQTAQLRSLPAEIEGLRNRVEGLRAAQAPGEGDPAMALPLQGTLDLLEQRQAELAALDHELAMLESSSERKTQELERLEAELKPLQAQKANAIAEAKEARRRKEEGSGRGDELEDRGRWYRGVESTMRSLLEVEG